MGIPGGFRGDAGFWGKFGVWGGFGRFGASEGFCANNHSTHTHTHASFAFGQLWARIKLNEASHFVAIRHCLKERHFREVVVFRLCCVPPRFLSSAPLRKCRTCGAQTSPKARLDQTNLCHVLAHAVVAIGSKNVEIRFSNSGMRSPRDDVVRYEIHGHNLSHIFYI